MLKIHHWHPEYLIIINELPPKLLNLRPCFSVGNQWILNRESVTTSSEGVQVSWGFGHELRDYGAGDRLDNWCSWSARFPAPLWQKESQKAKFLIYWSVLVPTLSNGHEGWVMTERMKLQIQAAEMCFLRWVASPLGIRWEVRSSMRDQAHPARKRPWSRPRSRWRDYISALAWERLGIPQLELADVAREREVWGPLLKLLPPWPDPLISNWRWMDG